MGALKNILIEIDEAIEAGAERWEAVTDAIIRWEIDPTSQMALDLEQIYLPENLPDGTSSTLH